MQSAMGYDPAVTRHRYLLPWVHSFASQIIKSNHELELILAFGQWHTKTSGESDPASVSLKVPYESM